MNLNLVPKMDENVIGLDVIKDYLNNKIEIQILTEDFKEMIGKIESILKYKNFDLVIIHLPKVYTNWEITILDDGVYREFLLFVKYCMSFSEKYNTKIKILGHLYLSCDALLKTQFKSKFQKLTKLTEGTDVSFLVENPVPEPYRAKSGESFYRFVKEFNNEKVRCCFDLCHYTVMKTLLKDPYVLPKDLGDYVESIHFSYFPQDKHVFEPNTHGIKHPDKEHILKDLGVLQKLGINLDTAYLVTEINEVDYRNRPDLLDELKNITEIIKN